ncbi:MAG: VWA domain-containing protein [bacterium]|nr:VWA domain-containing protein [bacterium]
MTTAPPRPVSVGSPAPPGHGAPVPGHAGFASLAGSFAPSPGYGFTGRRGPSRFRKLFFGELSQSVTLAVLIVGAGFLGAGIVIVARYIMPPPMMFQPAQKMPTLPARKLEHRIRVKQFEQQTQRPKLLNKLVTQTRGKLTLPPMPPLKLSAADMRTMTALSAPAGAQIGSLGVGGFGIGRAGSGGFQGFSEAMFFGHALRTRALIVLIDNSPSVRTRGVVNSVLLEMSNIVTRFHPDTRFNVIAYRDGATPFKAQMAYATQQGKQEFFAWLQKGFTDNSGQAPGYGTTPYEALKLALSMNPDTIVLIRDDQPAYLGKQNYAQSEAAQAAREQHRREMYKLIQEHQAGAAQRVTINTLLFKPSDERAQTEYRVAQYREARAWLQRLASMTGGSFREIAVK